MRRRDNKWQLARPLPAVLLGAACVVLAMPPALAQQAPPPISAQAPSAAPTGGAGITIYLDPQTGAVRDTPAPGTVPLTLSPREREALSTSHQDLVEVPSTVPGGGFKLDLQGRFQSPLIGTVDGSGKVKVEHLGEKPGLHDEK